MLLIVLVSPCGQLPKQIMLSQSEEQIVSFLRDFIIEQEIRGTADYVRSSGQPWVEAPPEANIIIWAPANKNPEDPWEYLNTDAPIRVWWYADGQLTEREDKIRSIERYRQCYMENPSSNIWAWGYYEFGILSIVEDGQEAEVYVGALCGPLCGHGFRYTLQRSPSGQWKITKAEHLWQR